jgi:hypothetical protein
MLIGRIENPERFDRIGLRLPVRCAESHVDKFVRAQRRGQTARRRSLRRNEGFA